MEATPLASLSLTHVHYVSTLLPSPHMSPPLPGSRSPSSTEPPRPLILPLRLAGPRAPSPLRHLRNPNMVKPRGRNPAHVRRTNGLRGAQLPAQAVDKGGETETYVRPCNGCALSVRASPVQSNRLSLRKAITEKKRLTPQSPSYRNERQRLWHALLPRPIPDLFLPLPNPLPPPPAPTPNTPLPIPLQCTPPLQPPPPHPPPTLPHLPPNALTRRIRRAQPYLSKLSYADSSIRGMCSGCRMRDSVVRGYGVGAEGGVGGCGVG